MEQAEVEFSVDAQLIGELGERLVTNHHIALSELIKNAYDADSNKVTITLSNVGKPAFQENQEGIITVSDNGVGMTLEQIKHHWMTIATANKSQSPTSACYGRATTGNKGIGRFACQRLARSLEMTSVAKLEEGYQTTIVTFKWDDFSAGKDITQVKCKYRSTLQDKGVAGLTLVLKGVRDYWTNRDFKMLQKSVAFISVASGARRKGYEIDPGFETHIIAQEFEQDTIVVNQSILSAGWGRLKGRVLNGGILSLTLDAKGYVEPESFKTTVSKELEGVHFEIYIMPSSSRHGIENRRDPTLLTNAKRDQIRRDRSGILVYLNNFRVWPYGDIQSGDDWLNIMHDLSRRRAKGAELLDSVAAALKINAKRAMLNHPSADSLIGRVSLDGKSRDRFTPKMDREGIIENAAFEALKNCIRLSLDWATMHYEAFVRREIEANRIQTQKTLERVTGNQSTTAKELVTDALSIIKKTVIQTPERGRDAKSSPERLSDAAEKIKTYESVTIATDVLETQFIALEAEIDTLRSVAATAPLLFVFSHEFKGIVASLLTHAANLEKLAKETSDARLTKALVTMADDARASSTQYTDIMKLFDVFNDAQNFSKKKVLLQKAIDQVLRGFSYLFSEFNIEAEVVNNFPVLKMGKMNTAEVFSIIINVISNAVKALIVQRKNRKIKISVSKSDGVIELGIYDTGVGIKAAHWDSVFDPFIADPDGRIYASLSSSLGDTQLATLGKGSGLGLHIVKSIITKHKGSIEFSPAPKPWSTYLKIQVPEGI